MAEIGLIASILQIASCGLKLSTTLYTFSESVAAADKSIKHIAKDVSLTAAVLNELGVSLENDKKQGGGGMVASDNALKVAEDVVHECSEVFNTIETTLRKCMTRVGGSGGAWGEFGRGGKLGLRRLIWPFLQPKMELLRVNLERLKSTMILMLNVLAYANKVNRATSRTAEHDFDRYQIESLIKSNKEAQQAYETMRRAIANDDVPIKSDRDGPRSPNLPDFHGQDMGSSNRQGSDDMKDDKAIEDPILSSSANYHSSSLFGSFNALPAQENPVVGSQPNTTAKAMSRMNPIALMDSMRQLGFLVDGIEDALSTITVSGIIPQQPIVGRAQAMLSSRRVRPMSLNPMKLAEIIGSGDHAPPQSTQSDKKKGQTQAPGAPQKESVVEPELGAHDAAEAPLALREYEHESSSSRYFIGYEYKRFLDEPPSPSSKKENHKIQDDEEEQVREEEAKSDDREEPTRTHEDEKLQEENEDENPEEEENSDAMEDEIINEDEILKDVKINQNFNENVPSSSRSTTTFQSQTYAEKPPNSNPLTHVEKSSKSEIDDLLTAWTTKFKGSADPILCRIS